MYPAAGLTAWPTAPCSMRLPHPAASPQPTAGPPVRWAQPAPLHTATARAW